MMPQDISVEVADEPMWKKFAPNAEMILTKPGRRLFPNLEYKVKGLTVKEFYAFQLNMERLDDIKYKFDTGKWLEGGKGDPRIVNNSIRHSDGFKSGQDWMNTKVSFAKCKITNNPAETRPTHIVLQSMHKYIPVLSIYRMGARSEPEFIGSYRFDFTAFYAVTAYQNHEITCLKKENNKYASGFRSKENRKRGRSDSPDAQKENMPFAKMPWMDHGFGSYYPLPAPFPPSEESMVAMGMKPEVKALQQHQPAPFQQQNGQQYDQAMQQQQYQLQLQQHQFQLQQNQFQLQQNQVQNPFGNYYDTKSFENFNAAYSFNSQYPQYPGGAPMNFSNYSYPPQQYCNNFMPMGMPLQAQPSNNQVVNVSPVINSTGASTSPASSYHSA